MFPLSFRGTPCEVMTAIMEGLVALGIPRHTLVLFAASQLLAQKGAWSLCGDEWDKRIGQ